jgi:amino acid adenylation domain-containing protein
MLRCRIAEDGTGVIEPESAWPGLTINDLRELDPTEREQRLAELRERGSERRLELERGIGFDFGLTLLAGGATRLHINVDMVVGDAQSFRIVLADLATMYESGEEALTPLELSFPHYLAARARERAAEPERGERSREYWEARLGELPGPPQLPLAVDPAELAAPRITRRYRRLTVAEQERLAARAADCGVTVPIVFATALAEVLAAWSAEPRFILNLPFYDRELLHPDVEWLVGDFTDVILLEVDASTEATFTERARALQQQLRTDARHAEYSGLEVLRELARRRVGEQAGAPVVFTSAVSLGELFDERVRRCFGAPAWTISQTPGVWLDCQVTEREGGIYVNWDAVEELFAPGVLDAMFGAFEGLLGWLAGSDGDWGGELPGLVPGGQLVVRERVNATGGVLPSRGLGDGFFAGAVDGWGDRPAVLWGGGCLSFGELRAAALRVAGVLRECGVGVGDSVVVSLPKGPGQVVAVLGVLAVGGVYVPVGVEQPVLRRARIVRAAGAGVVVGDVGLGWPDGVVCVSLGECEGVVGLSGPVGVDPDAVAYVIFTSGSTGEPKGVEVSHRAALNTIDAINDRWGVGVEDRALAVSALDFDLSVYDVFGLLDRGGAIVIPDDDAQREAAHWLELAEQHQVTIWNSVPALLDMLLSAAEGRTLAPSLRLAMVSGDWVGLDLHARLEAARPGCRLVALGGATEAAIWSNSFEVDHVDPAWRSIPYGYPLRNQRFRVVDARGRDCPDWVAGELWIGGAGVARGYRGDPERTARQFVERGGVRWYRTGDLGRYWPDGTLEFLGRRDHQIKLRGHRIELGEIEAAIESHPAVTRAVALLLKQPTPQLAVAVAHREQVAVEELTAQLTDTVPSYMVPSEVLLLDALPLSANGKIDRAAIEVLLTERDRPEASDEPPQGEVEEAVAAIWSELLPHAGIARATNFFAVGGDSMLATRMATVIRRRFGVELSLRRIFADPTVGGVAAAVGELRELNAETIEEGVV